MHRHTALKPYATTRNLEAVTKNAELTLRYPGGPPANWMRGLRLALSDR